MTNVSALAIIRQLIRPGAARSRVTQVTVGNTHGTVETVPWVFLYSPEGFHKETNDGIELYYIPLGGST